MKKNEGDKIVQEKIGSLSPLSGGIVFGKEEAWEKLQARMERKPARRMPLKYWLAAAAVLLLFVSVITVYNYPAKEIVKNKTEDHENKVVVASPETMRVIKKPEGMPVKRSPVPIVIISKRPANIPKETRQIVQPEITDAPFVQAPANEAVNKEVAVVNNTVPTPLAKKAMKVVHINELDNEVEQNIAPALVLNNFPALDVRKLPVVHINDVVREEYVMQRIRKDELRIGNISFAKPWYYNGNEWNTRETKWPDHPLRIKINIQN